MYCVLLVITLLNICSAEVEGVEKNNNIRLENRNMNHHDLTKREANKTVIDKDENMLRMPAVHYFNDLKAKPKFKKSPKRTIQKIIKKNKGKVKKIYFQSTKDTKTTNMPKYNDVIFNADEARKWKEETSTHSHIKQRSKNHKVVRNYVPFQKMQKKKEDRRHRRGLSRELFILKDLDQIEFLSKEKDNDVVKAHVTNYWKV